jgi:hypothetical protein
MQRGAALGTALALPALSGCSRSAEEDVRSAAEAFLGSWAEGHLAGAAAATTDPAAPTALLEQTATALADRGEVFGKTGTAEYGSNTPPDAHGWFMGYRSGGSPGDIAFAVLVEGGQSSSVAVEVTDAFLGALG